MKISDALLAIFLIVLGACNSKPDQQDTMADSEFISATTNSIKQSTMKGFTINIEKDATENSNFRKVLYTAEHMQLVLMSLKPGEEIGEETHLKSDQFFRFESGTGKCTVNGNNYVVNAGDVLIVPAGAKHNVINTDTSNDLKLYAIYAVPHHKDGIVRATKEEASRLEAPFDGKTTE